MQHSWLNDTIFKQIIITHDHIVAFHLCVSFFILLFLSFFCLYWAFKIYYICKMSLYITISLILFLMLYTGSIRIAYITATSYTLMWLKILLMYLFINSVSIHPSVDTSALSVSWLLWIMLKSIWEGNIFMRCWFHFLWVYIKNCWVRLSFYLWFL